MVVAVRIPATLGATCDGKTEIRISADSVQSALDQIEQQFPALYRSLCDDAGRVRPHVNLFVNLRHIRECEGLNTPLNGEDVLSVWPAVSGG